MDIDQALQASNSLGRTQILIFIASVLMNMQTGMIILSHVFLAEVPSHYCTFNSTYMKNDSISGDGTLYSKCEEYINPLFSNETQTCRNSWVYETELTGKSIVSEWDLVCDKDFLPGLSQSLLLAGLGLGSVIAGPLADKYGRRPTVIVAVILFNVIGLSVSLAPNYAVFVTLRHLMGGIFKSIKIPLTNQLYEFLPPQHRPTIGILPNLMIIFGYVVMTGFAYYVRDWRHFHLLIMSPCVILMSFVWLIPESVRWIISQGDMEKAEMAMQKVAKFNKAVDFPNPVFLNSHSTNVGNRNVPASNPEMGKSDTAMKENKQQHQTSLNSISQIFKQPVLTVTLVLSFGWIAFTMVYFGFALSSGSFSRNPYLNFLLISLADVPAIAPALFLVKRVGNIRPLFFGFLSAGVMMIAISVLPFLLEDGPTLGKLLTALAVFGKFCLGIAAPAMLLLRAELFPTTMRNSGTAVVHLIGSIGSLSSPLLLYLNKFFRGLAFIVMAVFAFIAMTMALLLPDTRGTVQPETPAEVQAIFDQKRGSRFGKAKQRSGQNRESDGSNKQQQSFDKETSQNSI